MLRNLMRLLVKILFFSILLFTLLAVALGWYFSSPSYKGPSSSHFDGTSFRNEVSRERSFWRFIAWIITRTPGVWAKEHINNNYEKPPARVTNDDIRITFVNHATTLIQIASMNILTDPIWSERCSPVSFAGPKRVRNPGVLFEDLPLIDVIVISHNHYDHLDVPTLTRLRDRDNPIIIAGLGNKALLESRGFKNVRDFDWWDHVMVKPNVAIWGVPAQHFSGRGLMDRDRTLWMGFVVQAPQGTVYFAGDTGFGPHFQQIHDRFGDITVALLPIGAFMPLEIMSHVHMSPTEALKAADVLRARDSVGVHFGTFRLADDDEDLPARELNKAKPQFTRGYSFHVFDFGESRSFR